MAKGQPEYQNTALQFTLDAVTFDPDAFDNFIRSQGVTLVHWRAMPCPVGMVDTDDVRRPHEDHSGCSNGFIHTLAGEVTVGFMANATQSKMLDVGRMDGSTVQVVLPRYYDQTDDSLPSVLVQPATYDRFYLKEEGITVVHSQLFQAHQDGVDRLHFPVVSVIDLMDSRGKRYFLGDFNIVNGQIKWVGPNRPGVDPKTQKGIICSIRFTYRPYWYVSALPHEVRVCEVEDEFTGDRRVQRMPQAAQLQREYVFEKEDKDRRAADPNSLRQTAGPPSGGFGPR